MTGDILATCFPTHVGGNIGGSLLEELPSIAKDHIVVLELSSFQLEDLPLVGIGPHVAVVTNLSPNHLDRHGTMSSYAEEKKNIFRFQKSDDVLILNADCQATMDWKHEAPGRVEFFDPSGEPFELSIPGAHNQANAQAAWCAARNFGADRAAAAKALSKFNGLPHRMELVAERGGVRYYNDSKCTTPEGAIVALEAFGPRRAILIAGGYDKGANFDTLAAVVTERAKGVIAIGATAEKIVSAVRRCTVGELPAVAFADDLTSAVSAARELARSGEVILLSPACASYDMFTNYEARGEEFTKLAKDR